MKTVAISAKSFEHNAKTFFYKRVQTSRFSDEVDINIEKFEEVIDKLIKTYKASPFKRHTRGSHDSAHTFDAWATLKPQGGIEGIEYPSVNEGLGRYHHLFEKEPVQFKLGYTFTDYDKKLHFKFMYKLSKMTRFRKVCQLTVNIK